MSGMVDRLSMNQQHLLKSPTSLLDSRRSIRSNRIMMAYLPAHKLRRKHSSQVSRNKERYPVLQMTCRLTTRLIINEMHTKTTIMVPMANNPSIQRRILDLHSKELEAHLVHQLHSKPRSLLRVRLSSKAVLAKEVRPRQAAIQPQILRSQASPISHITCLNNKAKVKLVDNMVATQDMAILMAADTTLRMA